MALYRDYLHERMTRLAASATVEGVPPLTLPKSAGKALKDYKVWGKSVQDGTPTPENPVEVQSVGDADVVWNQFANVGSGTKTTSGNVISNAQADVSHKFYYHVEADFSAVPTSNAPVMMGLWNTNLSAYKRRFWLYNSSNVYEYIGTFSEGNLTGTSDKFMLQLYLATGSSVTYSNVWLIDLTLMYGAGNEPATMSDPRITWIKEYVKQHPEYNAGTQLYKIPVQVTSGNSTVTTNIYLDEPLRGIGQAWDYVDFKAQKVVRAIRRVDLGELNWYKNSTYSVYFSTGTVFPAVQVRDSEIFCEKYEAQAKDWTTLDDKHIVLIRGLSVSGYYSCVIKDLDVRTSTEFKTLMNGVYLFCKYITPTEESITLPSVLTQKGSCVLGIGTTIQPNKVSATYIKG